MVIVGGFFLYWDAIFKNLIYAANHRNTLQPSLNFITKRTVTEYS